jgi:hypothetical protein
LFYADIIPAEKRRLEAGSRRWNIPCLKGFAMPVYRALTAGVALTVAAVIGAPVGTAAAAAPALCTAAQEQAAQGDLAAILKCNEARGASAANRVVAHISEIHPFYPKISTGVKPAQRLDLFPESGAEPGAYEAQDAAYESSRDACVLAARAGGDLCNAEVETTLDTSKLTVDEKSDLADYYTAIRGGTKNEPHSDSALPAPMLAAKEAAQTARFTAGIVLAGPGKAKDCETAVKNSLSADSDDIEADAEILEQLESSLAKAPVDIRIEADTWEANAAATAHAIGWI